VCAAWALWPAATPARGVQEPAPGVLLVAAAGVPDPRFKHSVILLIEHGRSGSWGLIINKPTEIGMAELYPELADAAPPARVYFGGPVEADRLSFLYPGGTDDNSTGAGPLPGVRWSDAEDKLKARLENAEPLRVYAGYAGWAPGQLELEIARGGWRMIQGRRDNVLSDEPGRLWQRLDGALSGIAI